MASSAARLLFVALLCVSTLVGLTSKAAAQDAVGVVAGLITDDTGAAIAEATVTLSPQGSSSIEVTSGTDGRFSVVNVPAGPFRLTVSRSGFAEQTIPGDAVARGLTTLPPIRLTIAIGAVSVEVTPTIVEVAERQIKEQEQQRVLGFVPNFFVSFIPDAAPLNARQKLQLSWKAHIDPVQFAFVGGVAGVQHWRDDYSGFGRGIEGYAKRYAAAYATGWTRSMITQVLLPSVFKQDPRYFYRGTGSTGSRLTYALSRSIIRKGDNGHWQPDYSGVLGSLASGAISNLYYPAEDRRGARLMLENTALGVVGGAIGHLAQEFLWGRATSRAHARPNADRP